jgi:hypothetical protein
MHIDYRRFPLRYVDDTRAEPERQTKQDCDGHDAGPTLLTESLDRIFGVRIDNLTSTPPRAVLICIEHTKSKVTADTAGKMDPLKSR